MDQSEKTTIRDVAKVAGVSIATVSRILNGKGGVSEELESRITDAIRKLSYVPNTVARALKAGQTKSLGLIIPTIENPVFPPLVKAIEERAIEHGISTILCNSEGQIEKEASYIDLLVEKQVDGIILNAMGEYSDRFHTVRRNRVPFLVIGRAIGDFRSSVATIDNFEGGRMITEYLIGRGFGRIAFLHGRLESHTAINDRFMGYRKALADGGVPYDETLVVHSDRSVGGGIEAAGMLMDSGVRFDAVFASNDIMAMGCISELIRRGKAVPHDVSVAGYDDIAFASIFIPNLTTIRSPVDKLGHLAMDMIMKIITTGEDLCENVVLAPELVVRDSTK